MGIRIPPNVQLNEKRWRGHCPQGNNRRATEVLEELSPAVMSRSSAIHEAGHAVVGIATGHTAKWMKLLRGGLDHAQTFCDVETEMVFSAHAAMIHAGIIAQIRWLRSIGASRQALEFVEDLAEPDRKSLADALRENGAKSSEARDGKEIAEVTLRRHWSCVERLAHRLDHSNELHGHGTIRSAAGM